MRVVKSSRSVKGFLASAGLLIALILGPGSVAACGQEAVQPPIFIQPDHFLRKYITEKVQPEYPAEAQQAGIQGTVLVFVVFDKEGKVVEAKPLVSPHELLSEAAAKAVKEWRMKPPYQFYPDAITWGELRFVFSIKEDKAEVLDAPDEGNEVSREFKLEGKRRLKEIRGR